MVKSCNLGSNFCKHSEVHEKAGRILSCYFLIQGAELQPCLRSWSLPKLHYRHSHTFLADPDLALLIWLPSLTSGVSHHSRLPWWSFGWPWLLSSNLLCSSSYSTVGLCPLLAKLWFQPVTVDPGSPLAEQPLLLLSNRRLRCGRLKIETTLFLDGIWSVNVTLVCLKWYTLQYLYTLFKLRRRRMLREIFQLFVKNASGCRV